MKTIKRIDLDDDDAKLIIEQLKHMATSMFNDNGDLPAVAWVHSNDIDAVLKSTAGAKLVGLNTDGDLNAEQLKEAHPGGLLLGNIVDMEHGGDNVPRVMAQLCDEVNADLYAFMSEVWMAVVNVNEPMPEMMPRDNPNRQERVMLLVETDGKSVMMTAQIHRPEDSPPTLGDFEVYPGMTGIGRVTGVLASNRAMNTIIGDAVMPGPGEKMNENSK